MKTAILVACLCFFAVANNSSIQAQRKVSRVPVSLSAESSNREQDGLNGAVRRVRVETTKLLTKDGKTAEARRVLREVTTYDPTGKKIDSVAYPVEGSNLAGKEQYQYDVKGNIVEMVLRSDDGSILSKEKYDYEFDEMGNWKKMTTSVAVYENGKLSYEPVEATYRTISYYYNESLAKLTAPTSKTSQGSRAPSTVAVTPSQSQVVATRQDSNVESKTTMGEPESSRRIDPAVRSDSGVKDSPSLPPTRRDNLAIESPVATSVAANSAPGDNALSESMSVTRVPEEALKRAAINLPKPEYSQAAMLARAEGNVEVEILVDQKGEVVSAHARSGDPLLSEAAEMAARKARFSRAKLSPDSARVYGVIDYSFSLPAPEASPATALTNSSREDKNSKTNERIPSSNSASQPAVPSVAEATGNASAPASTVSPYAKGVTFLKAGRYGEAVEALKEAIRLDPNDAVAYMKLGVAYSGSQQYKEAVPVFKMAIRIRRELVDAEAYYQLGNSYVALNKNGEAVDAFKQALYITRAQSIDPDGAKLESVPSRVEIHYSLGLAYHNMGRYNAAIKELQEVTALNPKLAEAYYGLALGYIGLGDRKSAEKQRLVLVSLNPVLAQKVANLLTTSPIVPPGVSEGTLRRR